MTFLQRRDASLRRADAPLKPYSPLVPALTSSASGRNDDDLLLTSFGAYDDQPAGHSDTQRSIEKQLVEPSQPSDPPTTSAFKPPPTKAHKMSSNPIDIPQTASGTDTGTAPSSEDPPISPVAEETKHNLEKLLAQRPERTDLEQKNVLRPGNLDPSLQAKKMELEKSLLEDKLNTALQNRPLPQELVKEGILEQGEAPQVSEELPAGKGEGLTPSH